MKVTKVTITAELEIEDCYVPSIETLKEDLLGEFIKVKSGLYENVGMGNIIEVSVNQTTPRKDA